MARRPLVLAAAVAVVATALGGCSVVDGVRDRVQPRPSVVVTPQPPPAGSEALARFYSQGLEWTDCSGAECASLTVPVDYDDPDGATIDLAVVRVPAKRHSKRIGALVVNNGGPGGSAFDYARAADVVLTPKVRDTYDFVGVDPRGVARSAPIDCVTDRQLDDFLGADPTPDDAAEERRLAAGAAAFATACGQNAGPLLAHVSTVDVARDLDILRATLGEEKLNYLGKSYGTYLGTIYADLFPANVGRFVLDGALPPDLTSEEINLGQAEGFERATQQWARYCAQQSDCPLGRSADEVMDGLRAFLASVDQNPLPRTGDANVPELTEGWASLGIAKAMYSQALWRPLVDALSDAVAGDGTALMLLADQYADRNPDGTYSGNIMEVIYAVNCVDRPAVGSVAEHEAQADAAAEVAPTWGRYLVWGSMPCAFWPVPATGTPHEVRATGAPPIVLIGTTGDPATPYEWAVRLNDQLDSSSLITFEGDGHTAYTLSNACVDDAVDAYYLDGTVPPDGLRC
jgi:pimeloyl-ACP methyl ester carboxylesterase